MMRPSAPALTIGRSEQVTADPGLEIQPSLSPDGKLIAYAAGSAIKMRIFIRPVRTGGVDESIPLSDDADAIETQPRWSPDGYAHAVSDTRRRIGRAPPSEDRRSPSSLPPARHCQSGDLVTRRREIAFVRGDTLFAMPAAGGPDAGDRHRPGSPFVQLGVTRQVDRVHVAEQRFGSAGTLYGNLAPSGILLFPVSGGVAVRIAEPTAYNQSPVFSSDGKRLFFLSSRDGPRDVYAINLSLGGEPRGVPVRLTTGLGAKTFSVSADMKSLSYASYLGARANVWSVPIPAHPPAGGLPSTWHGYRAHAGDAGDSRDPRESATALARLRFRFAWEFRRLPDADRGGAAEQLTTGPRG